MPQDGPRENPPVAEEELPEMERKRMLGNQASETFVLLGRLVFPVIVTLLTAMLFLMLAKEGAMEHLPKLRELPKDPLKPVGSLLELFIASWISVFIAWGLVIKATSIINEPTISRDLNNQARDNLQAARWMIFMIAFSAVWVISMFVLHLAGVEAFWIVLITLVMLLGMFIGIMRHATLVALQEWQPQWFIRWMKGGNTISSAFIVVTFTLYMLFDIEDIENIALLLFKMSMGLTALLALVATLVQIFVREVPGK